MKSLIYFDNGKSMYIDIPVCATTVWLPKYCELKSTRTSFGGLIDMADAMSHITHQKVEFILEYIEDNVFIAREKK